MTDVFTVDDNTLRDVVDQFAERWDGHTLADIAGRLTWTEVDALAAVLWWSGRRSNARGLLECWIDAEIEDKECGEGDYVIDEDEHGIAARDTREDA